jgi:hypothetical protein
MVYLVKILILLLLPICLFSQQKGNFKYIHGNDTSSIPYMYIGNDTLDYSCGGTMYIKVELTSLHLNDADKMYILKGNLSTTYGESLEDFGAVTIGKIEEITANTWLGVTTTGLLRRDTEIFTTEKGKFTIKVPLDYDKFVIFTAYGGATVIDIPFTKILADFNDK